MGRLTLHAFVKHTLAQLHDTRMLRQGRRIHIRPRRRLMHKVTVVVLAAYQPGAVVPSIELLHMWGNVANGNADAPLIGTIGFGCMDRTDIV